MVDKRLPIAFDGHHYLLFTLQSLFMPAYFLVSLMFGS